MLLIPIKMETDRPERPIVAVVIASLVLYQGLLLHFHSKMALPTISWETLQQPDFQTGWNIFLSLFRGAGPFSAIFIFLFLLVFGGGVEKKTGGLMIILFYLGGVLISLALNRYAGFATERRWWPGLGGVLACLGLAYFTIWSDNVRFFYFITAPPWRFGWGFESTASLFIMVFFHAIFALAQWVPYGRHGTRPPGIPTMAWTFAFPLLILVCCIACNKVFRALLHARRGTPDVASGKSPAS